MNLLPSINLDSLAPVAGLAAIAVAIILALLVVVLLRSRLALLLAVVAGIVIAGPALGSVIAQMINSLIGLVFVVGAITIAALFILHRNPELRAMLREVLPARPSAVQPPLQLNPGEPSQSSLTVIDHHAAQPSSRTHSVKSSGDGWGF